MKTHIFKIVLFLAIVFTSNFSFAQVTGYGYFKKITINYTQVSGTSNLTDFTMLYSVTDASLRTVVNGGNVQNANGYDIVFLLSSSCSGIPLSHEIETYNPVTGQYVGWIKIPTLSITANTEIYMFFGNAAISNDPSTTATWDANSKCVMHLGTSLNESTSNGNHGANTGTTVTTGKIGNARDFNGGSRRITISDNGTLDMVNQQKTFSAWVFFNSASYNYHGIISKNLAYFVNLEGGNPYQVIGYPDDGATDVPTTFQYTANAWQYITVTYKPDNNITNNGEIRVYRNGVQVASALNIWTGAAANNANPVFIGYEAWYDFTYFKGLIDEVHISQTQRSAGWILTEYNNQNSPSTFYSVGSLIVNNCIPLNVGLLSFTAEWENTENTMSKLLWTTASEINCNFFTVERSFDAINYEKVQDVEGGGNSNSILSYSLYDYLLKFNPIIYYKLNEIDFDGNMVVISTIALEANKESLFIPTIYPNPANENLNVILNNSIGDLTFDIYNLLGELIKSTNVNNNGELKNIAIEINELSAGTYFMVIKQNNLLIKHEKLVVVNGL